MLMLSVVESCIISNHISSFSFNKIELSNQIVFSCITSSLDSVFLLTNSHNILMFIEIYDYDYQGELMCQ